jgi:diadenosine tetraphosphate (Ap4A) HIT family hydrolase
MPGWQDADAWAAQWTGSACLMCADLGLPSNPHSVLVAELEHSALRLPRNQFCRGWTVVILKRHANELFELAPAEQAGFWQEVARVAAALQQVYRPVKLNYAVYGNLCPHVHCHLVPRYATDDPMVPVDMQAGARVLEAGALAAALDALREALGTPDPGGAV